MIYYNINYMLRNVYITNKITYIPLPLHTFTRTQWFFLDEILTLQNKKIKRFCF
jgi:hypothetical protein